MYDENKHKGNLYFIETSFQSAFIWVFDITATKENKTAKYKMFKWKQEDDYS